VNAILLVAIREFRQVARTRAFRIMLVGLPLVIGLSVLATRYLAGPGNSAYMIDDASGLYAAAIETRIDQDTYRPDDPASFLRAPLPAGVAGGKGAEAFARFVSPLLQGNVPTPSGPRRLVMAVYIPANFGTPGASARVWTNGAPNPQLMAAVRATLTQGLQRNALLRRGLDLQEAARIQSLRAPVIVTEPKAGTGRPAIVIRSAAPFALVYLLVMAVMMSGSMMLQGVIEERSNKLLEAILACIRPGALMKGKLFGLAAIGLLLIAVWVGIILVAGYTVHGPVADFLKPVLAGLTPWMIAALLFYFLTGYLVVSLIFLGIGSVSNSMQDAQGYLMPLIWALMIPIVLMVTSALRDPGGLFPRIMSWIPVYTPFAMLARLGGGVALWEVIGTGVLLIAFLAVEFVLIGRLFEANLLAAGQPPKWSMLKKVMSGK
jgi:ABC-2 type transport system permease protein